MAIDPSGMVMKLNPVESLDLTGFARAREHQDQLRMRREQLRLQREQFEEQRRQNAEMLELRKMEEAGSMARQNLQLQQQREADAAAAQAKLVEQRRAAQANARKYLDEGDHEGVERLMPEMNELGMLAEREGTDADGNPRYRIEQDRAAAEKAESELRAKTQSFGEGETSEQSLSRLEAMGYPTDERGNLDDPAADRAPLPTDETLMAEPSLGGLDEGTAEAFDPLSVDRAQDREMLRPSTEVYGGAQRGMGPAAISSGDAYAQALAASQYARDNGGQALKGPDAPDEMGAVPKNVYDTGAMKSQALRRLDPALGALANAQPEGLYRDSTLQTNEAVRSLGLSPAKSLEAAEKLRAGPDANIRSELAAGRKAAEDQAALDKPLSLKDQAFLKKDSRARAKAMGDDRGIPDVYSRVKPAAMIKALLSDKEGANDDAILFQLSKMLGSVGAQSNADLRVAASIDAEETVDKAVEQLHRWFMSGNTDERNKVLMGIVDKSLEGDKATVFEYLQALDEAIDESTNEYEASGLMQARAAVPSVYREQYDALPEEEEAEDGDAEPAPRQGVTVDAEGNPVQPTGGIEDDDEFMDALQEAADDADIDPELILPLIGAESGGDPTAKNPGSSARGLIQFTDATAQRYINPRTGKKFTGSAEFAQLSRAEQAPISVQYLKDSGVTSEHDQGDIYVAISAPYFLNKPDESVVYKEGTDEYTKNAHNWDLDNDGVITRGELYRWGMGERRKDGDAPAGKAEAKPTPGGGVLKRLSPTGVETPPAAAPKKSQLDAEVEDILR